MIRFGAPGVVLLATFLMLGYLVTETTPAIDTFFSNAAHGQWERTLGRIVAVVSAVLGPVLPVVALVVLAAYTVWAWRGHRRPLAGLLLRGIVLLAFCRLVSLFKPVYERMRPREYPDWSFPSGHVVSVASVGFTAIVLCAWLAPPLLRRVVLASALAVTTAAACRVLLDVHWLTDVVGGVLGVTGVGLLVAWSLRLLPPGHITVERADDQA